MKGPCQALSGRALAPSKCHTCMTHALGMRCPDQSSARKMCLASVPGRLIFCRYACESMKSLPYRPYSYISGISPGHSPGILPCLCWCSICSPWMLQFPSACGVWLSEDAHEDQHSASFLFSLCPSLLCLIARSWVVMNDATSRRPRSTPVKTHLYALFDILFFERGGLKHCMRYRSCMRACLPQQACSVSQGRIVMDDASSKSLQNTAMHLRKACNHPYLFLGSQPYMPQDALEPIRASGKLELLDRVLPKLHASGGSLALCCILILCWKVVRDLPSCAATCSVYHLLCTCVQTSCECSAMVT